MVTHHDGSIRKTGEEIRADFQQEDPTGSHLLEMLGLSSISVRKILQNPFRMISALQRGEWAIGQEHKSPEGESTLQGQGRQGDRDSHGVAVSGSATTTDAKAVDGGQMPVFTFSGSDSSDNDPPIDQSEGHWHETIKKFKATELTQKISKIVDGGGSEYL